MKHFLVTHWPVFLYLFKYFIGRSAYVYHSALSKPNIYRHITSVGQPLERGTMRHHSAKGSNREQETKDRQNLGKPRRSAPARVGGASSILYGSTHFRVSAKMPLPFGRVSGNLFAKRFPGLLFFGTLFCRSKRKYPQSQTIRPQ